MAKEKDENLVQESPFTNEEILELKRMVEGDRRTRWLWGSIRIWAVWIAAVIGGSTLFWDSATRMLKAMVGK